MDVSTNIAIQKLLLEGEYQKTLIRNKLFFNHKTRKAFKFYTPAAQN